MWICHRSRLTLGSVRMSARIARRVQMRWMGSARTVAGIWCSDRSDRRLIWSIALLRPCGFLPRTTVRYTTRPSPLPAHGRSELGRELRSTLGAPPHTTHPMEVLGLTDAESDRAASRADPDPARSLWPLNAALQAPVALSGHCLPSKLMTRSRVWPFKSPQGCRCEAQMF